MIYESQSKKEDNGKPINTKNLERGISIQKMEISKLTSQFVSGRSGSSKPRGERVRLKNMDLCLKPELKTKNPIYFSKGCISMDGKHFLCKTKSVQTANTHISVVHESSSSDI